MEGALKQSRKKNNLTQICRQTSIKWNFSSFHESLYQRKNCQWPIKFTKVCALWICM